MTTAIEVDALEKSYGSKKVLNGVTFQVQQGEIFALLGINGAGKTTTLECIEGLRKYDKGSISIGGKCGVQLQSSSLPLNMKAIEALQLFSKWQKVSIENAYVQRLGIEPFLNKQYVQMSTGQKRRLHLALALLGDPDIVILDEPTAGLDVEGRLAIHHEIKSIQEQGKTIILASHDMAEVEELCDHIGILKNGRIAFLGTSAELTDTGKNGFLLKLRFTKRLDLHMLSMLKGIRYDGEFYIFQTEDLESTLTKVIEVIKRQGISISDIKVERSGIEERFLEIAKEEQHESDVI